MSGNLVKVPLPFSPPQSTIQFVLLAALSPFSPLRSLVPGYSGKQLKLQNSSQYSNKQIPTFPKTTGLLAAVLGRDIFSTPN